MYLDSISRALDNKMQVFLLLSLCIAVASAVPFMRIVGGSPTTIESYPSIAAVLTKIRNSTNYFHSCGGIILNQRSVLSAAHCFEGIRHPSFHRIRVGSTWSEWGGTVYNLSKIIVHPNFKPTSFDSDVAVLRSATPIVYSNVVQPAVIAGSEYELPNHAVVWAAGWGALDYTGEWSTQLRHVPIWTIRQDICRERYGNRLTDNMLCSGWLNFGTRDQCSGDSGGPLYHNDIVVGICSFGDGCADPYMPGVNVRVSRFSDWIQDQA